VVDVNAGKKTFTSDPCMLAAKLSWNYGVTFAFTHGVVRAACCTDPGRVSGAGLMS
jgi:hypothetical protein